MREMRAIAAGLRRDAMSGFTSDEQEAFVDVLLAIKSNLVALNGQGTAGAPAAPRPKDPRKT